MPGAQERSDQLAEPGPAAAPPDVARMAEAPERGSLADLRHRLERLPPGHPSSPYDDDLRRKPPAVRLKDLELPLQGGEGAAGGNANHEGATRQEAASHAPAVSRADAANQDDAANHARAVNQQAAVDHAQAANQQAAVDHAQAANRQAAVGQGKDGSQEGPEPGADGVAAVAPEAASRNGSRGRSAAAGKLSAAAWTADPNAADGDLPADGSTTDGTVSEGTAVDSSSRRKAAAGRTARDGGTADGSAVPRGNGTGTASQHRAPGDGSPAARGRAAGSGRQPARQERPAQSFAEQGEPSPPPDRKNDATGPAAPGSWGSNGKRLDLVQRRIAEDALNRYRKAEGRNVFGTYGHSGLTSAMRRIEALLERGQLAPDTEAHALKPADRFRERLADLILRHPDKPAEELALEVHDGVRYAFLFDTAHYTEATLQVHSRLKGQGFELEVRRNCWENPEYKGINTRWRDPAHDLAFEVLFHTTSSWDVRQRAAALRHEITDPATSPSDVAGLRRSLAEMSAAIPVPPGCTAIPDFRREGQ
jgi:hypothetical protein